MHGPSCWLNTNTCSIVKIWLSRHHRLCLDWQSSVCALGTTWIRSSRYCENADLGSPSWLIDPSHLGWNSRICILNISPGFLGCFLLLLFACFGFVWGFGGFESWRESENKWLKYKFLEGKDQALGGITSIIHLKDQQRNQKTRAVSSRGPTLHREQDSQEEPESGCRLTSLLPSSHWAPWSPDTTPSWTTCLCPHCPQFPSPSSPTALLTFLLRPTEFSFLP